MDYQEEREYRGLIRGVALYMLEGRGDPPIDAEEIARVYRVDLDQVVADVNAVVQSERNKKGGAFQAKETAR